MAGTAPINSFFKTQARTTRQSTKRKALDLQNEDERDWTPSKRVKVGKGKAVEGTPASAKKKAASGSKQAKLAFGLQTPASTVATPRASSSTSRKSMVDSESVTPQARPEVAESSADAGLPTPHATARKGKSAGVARTCTDDTSGANSGSRAASPILVSSSSLDHISPPVRRAGRPARPLRHAGSIIELTSSEEEDVRHNPFLDCDAKPRSRSPEFELPQLSGPLSPLTQHSSLESSHDKETEFKIPELPTRLRDAPTSSPYSQKIVPSSQSQEVFGGPSMTSPTATSSSLSDLADLRHSYISSSPRLVPSSQTQELSMSEAPISSQLPLSSLPPSSLPPSSMPDSPSQSGSPTSQAQEVQPMLLSPLLNSPSCSGHARISPRNSPRKHSQSGHSQVESSQMEEIELYRPPTPSKGAWVPPPTNENSPSRQHASPSPLPGMPISPQHKTPITAKRITAVDGSPRHAGASNSKTPSKTPVKTPVSAFQPPVGSPTQEEITQTTPYKRRPHTDLATRPSANPHTREVNLTQTPASAYRPPIIDGSPTQEEITQTTPYKRHPRTDLVTTKQTSPLKPRAQSVAEDSDSDAELCGPLPAMRLGASQSDSDADDEADNKRAGPSSRPAPARIGNAPSFLYTGSGHRSRGSSQKSKQPSQNSQSQKEDGRLVQELDTQDSFFNSPTFLNREFAPDSGSFVGSIESDMVDYTAMDVDEPSFDLHTQDLLPVKSVLDNRRNT
ncbi:hypothetical protein PENSPDRAFT_753533 [Peniophora sp. CONT]|nr:hypothetical protein PENSPDRAFT_753533 [Peniophora sp. CONT]